MLDSVIVEQAVVVVVDALEIDETAAVHCNEMGFIGCRALAEACSWSVEGFPEGCLPAALSSFSHYLYTTATRRSTVHRVPRAAPEEGILKQESRNLKCFHHRRLV